MKKQVSIFVLITFLLVGVYAQQVDTHVLIKLEPGKKALVKVLDADTDTKLETPITENYGTGVAETTFTTSRDEVKLLLLLMEDGNIQDTDTLGPIETGTEVFIDLLAEKWYFEYVTEDTWAGEEPTEEGEAIVEGNSTSEVALEEETVDEGIQESPEESIEEEATAVETEETPGSSYGNFLPIGHTIFTNEEGRLTWISWVLGVLVITGLLLFTLFLIHSRKKHTQEKQKPTKKYWGSTSEKEEREYKEVEKKLKEKETELARLKQERDKKNRLITAERRLAATEEELRKFRRGEQQPQPNQ